MTKQQIRKKYVEGDVVVVCGHDERSSHKRVVFCERLGKLALQNKGEDETFLNDVRGNKMLSTFNFLPHYTIEKVGFEKIDLC